MLRPLIPTNMKWQAKPDLQRPLEQSNKQTTTYHNQRRAQIKILEQSIKQHIAKSDSRNVAS